MKKFGYILATLIGLGMMLMVRIDDIAPIVQMAQERLASGSLLGLDDDDMFH